MGELSQKIGKTLEHFGVSLFEDMGWETLAENLEIRCARTSHKNSENSSKQTHGIDILHGYYNPFTGRNEAIVIECKHHLDKDFIPSKVNHWIEELINTIECASASSEVSDYLKDYILVGGIILFNSSDNQYDEERAERTFSGLTVPKKRVPIMIYVANTARLEKWYSFCKEVEKIKSTNKNHNFGVIYPSICGSKWTRHSNVVPSYLFSDYIFSSYTKTVEDDDGTRKVDVKAIFCFDKGDNDSLLYLKNMIDTLQLEAHSDRKQEMHIYYYPEKKEDIESIKENFKHTIQESKSSYKLILMDNRRLSAVSYE